jgi:predicted XRE-type DNA-binding protein
MAGKSTKTIQKEEVTFEKGSGNVYQDLGYPNPEDMGRKSDLVHRLDKIIRDRGISQTLAAQIMGVDQSDLSKILRGQFRSVTFDKIFDMLSALGEDVMIIVHSTPQSEERRGRVTVAFG